MNINIFSRNRSIKFEHLTVDNGLSENAVTSIIQDKNGFLWFGTHDGLNKYDGYGFKIFRNDPKNNLTISSNLIRTIYEDSNGTLWVGTYDRGLNSYDQDKNKFTHFLYNPKTSKNIGNGNNITVIFEDKNKTIWVGTESGGLNKYNDKTKSFLHFFLDPNAQKNNDKIVTVMFEDSKRIFWIGTNTGLYTLNRNSMKLIKVKKNRIHPLNKVLDIKEDVLGNIWFTTNKGLNKLDNSNDSLIIFNYNRINISKISDDNSSKMCIDKNGLIWIGVWGTGFNIFDPATSMYRHFTHKPGRNSSLSHNRVTKIFKDKSDIIWIATEGGGINKFDSRKTVFENYSHDPSNKNSLSQNNIKGIYEDKAGILWIGTDGKGLNRFDRKKNKFDIFINNPNKPGSISSNYISAIFEDISGVLWVGTRGGGLNKYCKKTDSFIHYRYNQNKTNSIPSNTISDIIEDSYGVLWFAFEFGESGLARYDMDRDFFIRYKHNTDDPESISNQDLITIFEDKEKTIWCGGSNGLNRFDRKNESFTNYFFDTKNKSSLSHNWVWSILEDNKGRLWIGTYGGGLNLFNKKNNSFIHYTVNEGLANNVVYGILDDENGNLWISTNKGISKFNPVNESFKNYDKRDGLQGNEFNTGSYYKGKDGRLYFGGTNGLTTFFPEDVINNLYIPPIIITSFKVLNKEFNLPEHISKIKKINLKYNQNFISFEFASLDYSIPGKNRYAYKLEGINKNWIYRDAKKRFADYTDLPPGNYLFRVKGSNNDGIWNEQGISIKIHISPPFWKTRSFTMLWILIILIILLLIINFTYKYILLLKENTHTERFAAIGKYASFLAHDIKSPLEGTYLIMNELKEKLSDNDDKQEYIDDAIGGMNQIRTIIKGSLDFAKVNNPKLEVYDLKNIIKEFCFKFKKKRNCIFKVELSDISILLDYSLIERVFLNLFQNAYQARKETCEINIKTEQIKGKVIIHVSDTGKGISKKLLKNIFNPFTSSKEEGIGIGLAFVSEVIKNHKGIIKVESELDKGTTFIIYLPIDN